MVSRRQGPFFIPLNIGSLVSVNFGAGVHERWMWERWADNLSEKRFKGRRISNPKMSILPFK